MVNHQSSRADRFTIARYLNTRSASMPGVASDNQRIAFVSHIAGVPQG